MKKFFLTALGLVGLLLGSCQQDDLGVTGPDTKGLKLRLSVQGMGAGETRATVDAEDGEQLVNTLHLFFFDPSSDRSGTYQGYLKLDGPLTMNTDIELNGMSSNVDLNAAQAYKILAVANVQAYAPYLGVSEAEWLATFTKDLTTESSVYKQMLAYIEADSDILSDQIIMTGEANKPADALATIPLTLTRGLVRFDVVNSARASYDLVSVSIWNAFPQTSMFGGGLLPYESMGRIQRFYGINDNHDNSTDTYPDIMGGLYAFPNQVIAPEEKDQKTTCLIIGLKDVDDLKPVSYHRININAQDAMQNLKRNNVYRLTVRSVSGQGAGSEIEAYTGGINNINYKINYWDLDDDGLIQQNGNIILGIPTKRIRFGAEEEERSYDIFAFGGAAGEQIVVSTSDLDPDFTVSQTGNSITVKATALTIADQERTGTIRITYGGLTATIGILQTGEASKFLRVITPTGNGLPPFPYYSAASASVEVAASGDWTATIYQFGTPNYFTFDGGQTTISSTNLSQTVNLHTANTNSALAPRQAFVLFALASDPDNFNSALVLTQRAMGGISLSPDTNPIKWDGSGNLTTSGGSTATDFKFMVVPTLDVQNKFLPWTASLDGGSGSDFMIVDSLSHATDATKNYVIVKAKGQSTGTSVSDVLKVSLQDNSASATVNLIQENFELHVNPYSFPAVSNKGGQTGEITVSSNNTTLTWSAEVLSTAAAGGTIRTTHLATIIDPTTNTDLSQGTPYALTQKFKVKFPKLLYGDHNKGAVTATVKVTLWNGALAVKHFTFTVDQNALTPKNVNIANYHGYGSGNYNYGNLYGTSAFYNYAWRTFITNLFSTTGSEIAVYPASQTVSKIYTPNNIALPGGRVSNANATSSTVTYVHASQANIMSGVGGTYGDQQGAIEDWRREDYGVLVASHDYPARSGNSATVFWPFRSVGWSGAGDLNSSSTSVRSGTNSKITDFIYNKGPFGAVGNDGTLSFYYDGSSQAMNISGTKGVAIIGADNRAAIVIDPVNRIVFFGEGQFFSDATGYYNSNINVNLQSSKSRLLANIAAYVMLTAQYGSNFSDLFID